MESAATGPAGPGSQDHSAALADLVGSGALVPCLDGVDRVAVELDQAASTQAHPLVAERVTEFLPWYSSVHRGAGFRSRRATHAYEEARRAVLAFAGRAEDGPDVAILCRNTTEAINQLAYRLRLDPTDVVVTTVVEHHANLLPWGRVAERRYVECGPDGTFTTDDVVAALEAPGAAAGAAGRHRGLQRDRVAPADRRHHRRRPTPAASGWWSTPPSWRRTDRSRPPPTSWP